MNTIKFIAVAMLIIGIVVMVYTFIPNQTPITEDENLPSKNSWYEVEKGLMRIDTIVDDDKVSCFRRKNQGSISCLLMPSGVAQ